MALVFIVTLLNYPVRRITEIHYLSKNSGQPFKRSPVSPLQYRHQIKENPEEQQ